jgi:hypothetical protein
MENEEKLNKKIKNDLIKECNSESIKIDKKLFTKYINSKKEYDYEKKKILIQNKFQFLEMMKLKIIVNIQIFFQVILI